MRFKPAPIATAAALYPRLRLQLALLAATPEELIRTDSGRNGQRSSTVTPEKEQAEALSNTRQTRRAQIVESNPEDAAEPLIWEGIVVSSEAGATRRPRRTVAVPRTRRQRLEEALKINDKALNGSAYTSLATLYAKVPGWPVGFGDKAKCRGVLFRKSLSINPDGIDPNFFYGEYLVDHAAVLPRRCTHLEIALKAPPRPGRELADSGRRQGNFRHC
jgi:hypothetical protein